MAIEGPLRELALADVLQLLHLSRKTGVLSVRADHESRPALVHLDQGAVVAARTPGDGSRLGSLLIMAGKATVAQVEAAVARQRHTPGLPLGIVLTETQGIPPVDVERQLRFQIEETVFELLRWREGYFHFEEMTAVDPGPLPVRVSTEGLIMEAARRTDEWSRFASGEPDASLVPMLVEQPADATTALTLQPREWQVLAAVNASRTLRDIARELGRAEFEVAKAVYSLVAAGVVELRTRSARAAVAHGRESVAHAIARIETDLQAGRVEAARAAVGELAAEHPRDGAVSLLAGRVEARDGRWSDALRRYEEAVRWDPLLASAYFHLAIAAIKTGDLGRARESLAIHSRLPVPFAGQAARAARMMALIDELQGILEEEP